MAVGSKSSVLIVDQNGDEINSIETTNTNRILCLDWSGEGSTLAILQVGASLSDFHLIVWFRFHCVSLNVCRARALAPLAGGYQGSDHLG